MRVPYGSAVHRRSLFCRQDWAGAPEAVFSGISLLVLPPLHLPLLLCFPSLILPTWAPHVVSQAGTTQNWRVSCSLGGFGSARSYERMAGVTDEGCCFLVAFGEIWVWERYQGEKVQAFSQVCVLLLAVCVCLRVCCLCDILATWSLTISLIHTPLKCLTTPLLGHFTFSFSYLWDRIDVNIVFL